MKDAGANDLSVNVVRVFFVLVCATTSNIALAQVEASLGLNAGTRQDNLNWNIADSDGSPDILSELNWRDLRIHQIGLNIQLREQAAWVSGDASYGRIVAGTNQDSDYAGDGRSFEFSRSNNSSRGEVADGEVKLGYEWLASEHATGRTMLSPFLGYAGHQQNINIVDGHQTIPSTGAFDGLRSSYDARWRALIAGLQVTAALSDRVTFLVAANGYFRGSYRAEADWNLISGFDHPVSFRHEAHATGHALRVGGSYLLNKGCGLDVNVYATSWDADPGTDTTYYSDGTSERTTLNDVNWTSRGIRFGFTCS